MYKPNVKHSDGLAGENESWTDRGVDFIVQAAFTFNLSRFHSQYKSLKKKKTPCYYIIIINRIAARRLTDYCIGIYIYMQPGNGYIPTRGPMVVRYNVCRLLPGTYVFCPSEPASIATKNITYRILYERCINMF